MNCPRDNSPLRQVVREGTKIDVCGECHGKWLDEGELEQLVLAGTRTRATATALKSAMAAVERPGFVRAAESDPDLACPRCGVLMQKVPFESGGASLTADRCENCRGLWLDRGETGALFVFLEKQLPARGIAWALLGLVGVGLLATYWLLTGD